jgi:glycosyltransferase involved in cell wall biosynthesis
LRYFSIVITTYNRLIFLKRAIASAINQTIDCEVVVVDDCSSDGTLEYLKTFKNKIKWHRNQQNLGHCHSVNIGVAISEGKWIKLLDDDDYLAADCLEKISREIEKNPQAVICSCQAINIDEKETKITMTRKVANQINYCVKQEDIHYLMLLDKLPFGTTVQVAFCQDAFRKSGGWNSRFNYLYDDIESWVKISKFGDAIFINQPLVYRTIWKGGYNQKYSIQARLRYNILIKEKIYELVNSKYQPQIPSRLDIGKYLHLYWSLVALKNKKFLAFIKIAFPAIFSLAAWQLIFLRYCPLEKGSELKFFKGKSLLNSLFFGKKIVILD